MFLSGDSLNLPFVFPLCLHFVSVLFLLVYDNSIQLLMFIAVLVFELGEKNYLPLYCFAQTDQAFQSEALLTLCTQKLYLCRLHVKLLSAHTTVVFVFLSPTVSSYLICRLLSLPK